MGHLLKGRLLDVQNQAFFKHWPQMGSKRPSGSILGRFGEGFGRIWGRFGRVWGRIWKDSGPFEQVMGRFWKCFALFGPAVAKLINGTPALIREASQYAGVPPSRGRTGP